MTVKLDRTTNGSGAVEEKTLVELRKLNTKKGNKMITLDELMDFLKGKPGLYVEFEMKTNPESLYPEESLPEYVDKLYKKVMSNKPSDAEFLLHHPMRVRCAACSVGIPTRSFFSSRASRCRKLQSRCARGSA